MNVEPTSLIELATDLNGRTGDEPNAIVAIYFSKDGTRLHVMSNVNVQGQVTMMLGALSTLQPEKKVDPGANAEA